MAIKHHGIQMKGKFVLQQFDTVEDLPEINPDQINDNIGRLAFVVSENTTYEYIDDEWVKVGVRIGTTTGTALDGQIGTEHINDTVVHLSEGDKTNINNHINDTTIKHFTDSTQKTNVVNHLTDNDVHFNNASEKLSYNNHISDSSTLKHFATEQIRTNHNNHISDGTAVTRIKHFDDNTGTNNITRIETRDHIKNNAIFKHFTDANERNDVIDHIGNTDIHLSSVGKVFAYMIFQHTSWDSNITWDIGSANWNSRVVTSFNFNKMNQRYDNTTSRGYLRFANSASSGNYIVLHSASRGNDHNGNVASINTYNHYTSSFQYTVWWSGNTLFGSPQSVGGSSSCYIRLVVLQLF